MTLVISLGLVAIFFALLSVQYTLDKIVTELKHSRRVLIEDGCGSGRLAEVNERHALVTATGGQDESETKRR